MAPEPKKSLALVAHKGQALGFGTMTADMAHQIADEVMDVVRLAMRDLHGDVRARVLRLQLAEKRFPFACLPDDEDAKSDFSCISVSSGAVHLSARESAGGDDHVEGVRSSIVSVDKDSGAGGDVCETADAAKPDVQTTSGKSSALPKFEPQDRAPVLSNGCVAHEQVVDPGVPTISGGDRPKPLRLRTLEEAPPVPVPAESPAQIDSHRGQRTSGRGAHVMFVDDAIARRAARRMMTPDSIRIAQSNSNDSWEVRVPDGGSPDSSMNSCYFQQGPRGILRNAAETETLPSQPECSDGSAPGALPQVPAGPPLITRHASWSHIGQSDMVRYTSSETALSGLRSVFRDMTEYPTVQSLGKDVANGLLEEALMTPTGSPVAPMVGTPAAAAALRARSFRRKQSKHGLAGLKTGTAVDEFEQDASPSSPPRPTRSGTNSKEHEHAMGVKASIKSLASVVQPQRSGVRRWTSRMRMSDPAHVQLSQLQMESNLEITRAVEHGQSPGHGSNDASPPGVLSSVASIEEPEAVSAPFWVRGLGIAGDGTTSLHHLASQDRRHHEARMTTRASSLTQVTRNEICPYILHLLMRTRLPLIWIGAVSAAVFWTWYAMSEYFDGEDAGYFPLHKLCDGALALGSVIALWTVGRIRRAHLLGSKGLLGNYARIKGFTRSWQWQSGQHGACAILLWLVLIGTQAFCTAMGNKKNEAEMTGADMWVGSFICSAVASLTFLAIVTCLLHVANAMVLMVDRYAALFVDCPDIPKNLEDWNTLQAILRRASECVAACFVVLHTTAIIVLMLAIGEVLLGGPLHFWAWLSAMLRMTFMVGFLGLLTVKAAEVSGKCDRVPTLVNSLQFGKAVDSGRQYLVQYMHNSDAGFHLFEEKITLSMSAKFVYFVFLSAGTMITRVLSETSFP